MRIGAYLTLAMTVGACASLLGIEPGTERETARGGGGGGTGGTATGGSGGSGGEGGLACRDYAEHGWAIAIGGPGTQRVRDLAWHDGATIVVGHFDGELMLDDVSMPTTQSDGFIIALADSGAVLWSEHVRGNDASFDRQDVHAVDTLSDGSVVVAGYYQVDITLGGMDYTPMDGGDTDGEPWAARFSPTWEPVWGYAFDVTDAGQGSVSILDLTVFGDDEIAVVGVTGTRIDELRVPGQAESFGPLANSTGDDGFVIVLDAETGHIAAEPRMFALDGTKRMTHAAPRGDEFVVAGHFEGNLDVSTTVIGHETSNTNVAVIGLDAVLQVTWYATFGGDGDEAPVALAVDAGGDVHVAFTFTESLEVGGEPLVPTGTEPNTGYVRLRPPTAAGAEATITDVVALNGSGVVEGLALVVDGCPHLAGGFDGMLDSACDPGNTAVDVDPFRLELGDDGIQGCRRLANVNGDQTITGMTLGDGLTTMGTFGGEIVLGERFVASGIDSFVHRTR